MRIILLPVAKATEIDNLVVCLLIGEATGNSYQMIEIRIKYKIWDYVTLIWWEERMRVVWYEYLESRWIRYIMSHWHEYQYHYETEIVEYKEKTSLWFKHEE